jgi:hypothetical protein
MIASCGFSQDGYLAINLATYFFERWLYLISINRVETKGMPEMMGAVMNLGKDNESKIGTRSCQQSLGETATKSYAFQTLGGQPAKFPRIIRAGVVRTS